MPENGFKNAYLFSSCGVKTDFNNGFMENSIFYCGFSPNYNNIQSVEYTTPGSTNNVTLKFAEEDKGIKLEMPTNGPSSYNQEWTNYVKSSNGVMVLPVYIAMHTYINNDHYANQALAMAWMIKDAGRSSTKEKATGSSIYVYSRYHYGRYGEWNTCCLNPGTIDGKKVLSNAMNGLRKHAYNTYGESKNDNYPWCNAIVGDETKNNNITSPTQWSPRTTYIHCTGSYNYGGGYVSLNQIHFTTKGNTTGADYSGISVWIPRSTGELATEIPLTSGIYDSTNKITHYFAYFYNNVVTAYNDYAYSGTGTPTGGEQEIAGYNGLTSERGYGYDAPLNIPVSKIACSIKAVETPTPCSQSGIQFTNDNHLAFGTSRYISSFTTKFNLYITNSGNSSHGFVIGSIDCVLSDYTWAYSYVYSHIWHSGHMVYDENKNIKTPVFYSLLFLQHLCSDNLQRTGDPYGYGWNTLYPNMSIGQITGMDNTINGNTANGYLSVTKTLGSYIYNQSDDGYPTNTGKYGINNITLIKNNNVGNNAPYSVPPSSYESSVEHCRRFNTIRCSNNSNRNLENYADFNNSNSNYYHASNFLTGLNRGLYIGTSGLLSDSAYTLDASTSSLYGEQSGTSARIGEMEVVAKIDLDLSSVNINGVPLRYLTSNFPLESMNSNTPNIIKFDLKYILTTVGGGISEGSPTFKLKIVEMYDNDLKNSMVGNEKKIYLPIERNTDFNYFNAELRLPLIQIDENFSNSTSTNTFIGPNMYSYNDTGICKDKDGNEFNTNDVEGIKFQFSYTAGEVGSSYYQGSTYTSVTFPITLKIFNDSSTFGMFDLAIGSRDSKDEERNDDGYNVPKETVVISDLLGKILIKGDKSKISDEVLFNEMGFETSTQNALNAVFLDSTSDINEAISSNPGASQMLPSGTIISTNDTSEKIIGQEDGVMNVGSTGASNEDTEVPITSKNICVINRCTGEVIGVGAGAIIGTNELQTIGQDGMSALKGRCINKNFLPLLSTVIKVY